MVKDRQGCGDGVDRKEVDIQQEKPLVLPTHTATLTSVF